MQRLFGSWGENLSEDDYARAVAAWVTQEHDVDHANAEAIRRRLAASEPVRLRRPGQPRDTIEPAREFAAAWVEASRGRSPRLKIDWNPDGQRVEDIVAWLQHPAVGAASVFATVSEPDARLGAELPWRLRVLGRRADGLTQRLRTNASHDELYEIRRGNRDIDLLFYDGSLREAAAHVASGRRPLNADVLIVLGGSSDGPRNRLATCRFLMGALEAGGVVVLEAPRSLEERELWVQRLLALLSRNFPFDLAVFRTAEQGQGKPPTLLCDPRLLDSLRMQTHLNALARFVDRLPEDRVIRLGERGLPIRSPGPPTATPVIVPIDTSDLDLALERLDDGDPQLDAETAPSIGRLARLVRDATDQEAALAPARFLQCQLHEPGDEQSTPVARVQPQTPYALSVRIAEPDRQWLSGARAFVAPERPADGPEGHRLTVVVWEASAQASPQHKTLWLPTRGDSDAVDFAIELPEGKSTLRARIIVLHHNRVLQTGELRARVGDETGPQFELDGLPRTRLERLDRRSRFDMGLVLNGDGTEQQLTAVAGDGAIKIDLDQADFDDFTGFIKRQLDRIALRPEDYARLDADATVTLLRNLAQKGGHLHEVLFEGHPRQLPIRDAERIHLTCAKSTSFLPLELLYRHGAPDDDAPLCPHALTDTGRCSGEGETPCPADMYTVVCPYGFWGMDRVIERYAPTPGLGQGNSFEVSETIGDRRELPVVGGSVVAASANASLVASDSVSSLVATLDELQSPAGQVADWDEWKATVEAENPGLLVLLPHHLRVGDFEFLEIGDYSELGDDARLKSGLVRDAHVAKPRRDPGPIVLLLGCQTQLARIAFDSFVGSFSRKGAAIVVSTVATVLGRHVGPAAECLAQRLHEAAAENRSFGEAMLAARRATVFDVSAMALGLAAYGDADWRLTHERPEGP